MKYIINVIFLAYFFFPIRAVAQQESSIEAKLKKELDSMEAGGNKVSRYQFNSSNERYFLDFLERYDTSHVDMVKMRVMALKYQIGNGSLDTALRQRIVFELIAGIDNKSSLLNQYAINRLLDFKEKDFSSESRLKLTQQFALNYRDGNFILVCGIAQVRSLIPSLERIASGFSRSNSRSFSDTSWYARLALARMHMTKSLDTLISAVELYPDKSIRVTILLRQLAYTKHPDAIRLLHNYLKSFDNISENENYPGFFVNLYAMEFLAIYCDNFPVKPKGLSYTAEERQLALAFLDKIDDF